MDNEENIILFSNIKLGIEKYGNLVRKILDSNLEDNLRRYFY